MTKLQDVAFITNLCFYLIRKRKISRSMIIQFCKERLEKRPHDVFSRRVLAWFYAYGDRDYPKAAAEYKKLIERGEESFDIYKALGFAQRNMGDFIGAITALEHAERIKPGDLTVLPELGYVYMRTKRYREALGVLEKAIRLGHQGGLLNWYRGFCFLNLGEYKEAVEEYEKALLKIRTDTKLAEEAAIAHTNLGTQFLKERKWDPAAEEFRKARELDPHYFESLAGVSNVMLFKKEFAKAVELGNEMIRKNPADHRGYLIVSTALKEKGNISEAIEICEKGKSQANDPEGHLTSSLTALYRSLG